MGSKAANLRKGAKSKDVIERPQIIRKYKQFFLIVCEGEKMEYEYFKQFKDQFPEKTMYLEPVGAGVDGKGTVDRAIEEKKNLINKYNKSFDFVWVVFDKDNAGISDGNRARFELAHSLADQNNIEIALSNECFELWLLLHFIEVNAEIPIPRRSADFSEQSLYSLFYSALREIPKYETYEYNHDRYDPLVLEIIQKHGNEELAMQRAEALLKHHENIPPIEANPSTTVYKLVRVLRDWIAYYSGV